MRLTSGINTSLTLPGVLHVFTGDSIGYYLNLENQIMIDKEEECEKVSDEIAEQDFAKPEMQESRAFLRERFLRVITGIVGKPAEFNLYENSKVSGEFRGCDVDGLEVYVRDLDTPLGKVPEAILRTTDIIHFTVKDISSQQ